MCIYIFIHHAYMHNACTYEIGQSRLTTDHRVPRASGTSVADP